MNLSAPVARSQRCLPEGAVCPAAPDVRSSSAGYIPSDMPVKAKRSTYNYSLPITIKKMRECPGLTWDQGRWAPHTRAGDRGHLDCGRGRSFPREHLGAAGQHSLGCGRMGRRAGWGAGRNPLYSKALLLSPHSQPACHHA